MGQKRKQPKRTRKLGGSSGQGTGKGKGGSQAKSTSRPKSARRKQTGTGGRSPSEGKVPRPPDTRAKEEASAVENAPSGSPDQPARGTAEPESSAPQASEGTRATGARRPQPPLESAGAEGASSAADGPRRKPALSSDAKQRVKAAAAAAKAKFSPEQSASMDPPTVTASPPSPAPRSAANVASEDSVSAATNAPRVSIVIPVYNEEAIVAAAIADLRERLSEVDFPSHEIVLAENGSRDATVAIAARLTQKHPEVRYLSLEEPNYGKALRQGIREARGEFVICDEIDLCDVDFYRSALWRLENEGADMVVGSKAMAGAKDERPLFRKVATRVFNGMLRVTLGFRGTDTHGLKAFRRERLLGVVERCLADKDVFASEFVIRAMRDGFTVIEIPVRVMEKRPPSINLARRVPNVLKNLGKLFMAIRLGRPPPS